MPHASQKAFADCIGSRSVIGGSEDFNSARCCDSSERGSKFVIVITQQILGGLPIGCGFPKLLRYPGIGRGSDDSYMDHSSRLEFDDEEGKEGAKEEIRHRKARHKPRCLGHGCAGMSSTSVLLAAGRERTSCTSGWSAWSFHLPFEYDERLSQEGVFRHKLRLASAKVCEGFKRQ